MTVPSKTHWFPDTALLVSKLPLAIATGAGGIGLVITVKVFDVAGFPVTQDWLDVITR
jgi:hypothetical protein